MGNFLAEYKKYKATFHATAALRSHPRQRHWRRPRRLAAACHSGAPPGLAKAQRGLDMPLRMGEGSVSGGPWREGLGTAGWGKLREQVA